VVLQQWGGKGGGDKRDWPVGHNGSLVSDGKKEKGKREGKKGQIAVSMQGGEGGEKESRFFWRRWGKAPPARRVTAREKEKK